MTDVPRFYFQTHYFSANLVESNPDLWICSQESWPLDHRGGPTTTSEDNIYG
jgi:hypothetical protein